MSVRSRVRSAMAEIRDGGDLLPHRAAQLLMELTALLGNCSEEIRQADYEYSLVLLRELEANDHANRAKIKAEVSPEYGRRRAARDTQALVAEMVRSLKIYIRSMGDEMRLVK